jgi:FkbM family methyltransferase
MGGGDLRELMALLKALWKLRPPGEPEAPGARLVRRWREKGLLARVERDWPGGFTLHRTGDLVYVPRPLDRRGRHVLLHPPRVHPAALASLHPGSAAIDVGASLGEWTVPLARAVGPTGRVLAVEPVPRSAAALEATLAANSLHQAQVVRCAVGDREGSAELAVPVVTSARSDTGTARIGVVGPGHQRLSVCIRTLASLAGEFGLDRVDLITAWRRRIGGLMSRPNPRSAAATRTICCSCRARPARPYPSLPRMRRRVREGERAEVRALVHPFQRGGFALFDGGAVVACVAIVKELA